MAGTYRNKGARWRRPDGTVIERGAEFEPTDDEKLRKAYKLEYIGPKATPATQRPTRDELADFDQGNGWYMVGGEKYHGREAASDALRALKEAEQEERAAYRLGGS